MHLLDIMAHCSMEGTGPIGSGWSPSRHSQEQASGARADGPGPAFTGILKDSRQPKEPEGGRRRDFLPDGLPV